jgi:hypothetical protein
MTLELTPGQELFSGFEDRRPMSKKNEFYIPALRYRWLTRFYDPVVALTAREQVFRRKLLGLIKCTAGDRVLDLACGTGTLTRMIKSENPATTVHGLDGDPEILELALKNAQHEDLDMMIWTSILMKACLSPCPTRTTHLTWSSLHCSSTTLLRPTSSAHLLKCVVYST